MRSFVGVVNKSVEIYYNSCRMLSKLYASGILGEYSDVDHIAFRGINNLEEKHKHIIESGVYKLEGVLEFPEKAIKANWYSRTTPIVPKRMFVSAINPESKIADQQYINWVLKNGDNVNHMAYVVDDINKTIEMCIVEEIPLNVDDGVIKISKDGKLLQASTRGNTFVEFVQRVDGREGFEVENAGPIFNSTKKSLETLS